MMVKDLGLKYFLCGLILIVGCMVRGQDSLLLADSVVVHETLTKRVVEETAAQKEQLIDGIVAVVGDGIVLKSDYESKLLQLKEQGVYESGADCFVWKELLFQKLLVHQAEIDSIPVTDKDVDFEINRRLQYLLSQMGGSEDEFKKQFGRTILQFKEEVRPTIKETLLARKMQAKVSQSVIITPKEVEQYYKGIPSDSLPIVEEQYKIAQIIIQPRASQFEKNRVRKKLEEIRSEIIKGKDFGLAALLNSEDPGSKMKRGELGFVSKDNLVPAFANAAFKLQPGEISEIVESDFGFHIIELIDKKGTYVNVRHILLTPKIYSTDIDLAKLRVDSVLKEFGKGKVSFNKLASQVSDDKRSKDNGGVLLNYATGKDYFAVRDLEEDMYFKIQKLKKGEVSEAEIVNLMGGKRGFRIVQLMDKVPFHVANIERDYNTIKEGALAKKKEQVVKNWINSKVTDTYLKLPNAAKNCQEIQNWVSK